jgi:hypothetical protein
MNKAECPEFDHFDPDKILSWAKAEVIYEDTFTNRKTGITEKNEKYASWTLFWEHGFIGFDAINKKEDEVIAKRASAMFIYLWCKGVSASIADSCASLYARYVELRRL